MAFQDLCPEAHGLRCERDVAEGCRGVVQHENIRGHQCGKNIGAKAEKHQIVQLRSVVYVDSAPNVPKRDQCAKNLMKLVISPLLVREITKRFCAMLKIPDGSLRVRRLGLKVILGSTSHTGPPQREPTWRGVLAHCPALNFGVGT